MTRLTVVTAALSHPLLRGCAPAHPTRRTTYWRVLTAAAMLLLAAPAAAAMYKWTDANGHVVYSDQPPPANIKSEIVKPPPPPANPNAAQELADRESENKLRDKKRAEAAKAQDKTRVDNDKRRETCQTARGQLRALLAQSEIAYRYNENGERIVLDDAMRLREIEQLQQLARDNCGG